MSKSGAHGRDVGVNEGAHQRRVRRSQSQWFGLSKGNALRANGRTLALPFQKEGGSEDNKVTYRRYSLLQAQSAKIEPLEEHIRPGTTVPSEPLAQPQKAAVQKTQPTASDKPCLCRVPLHVYCNVAVLTLKYRG